MKAVNPGGSKGTDNEALTRFISHPARSLIRLAVPITIGMGINVCYFVADMIFVGRLGGDAIAAVTFAGPFFFFLFSLASIGVGAQALIAQKFGAGDRVGTNRVAVHTVLLALVLGVVLAFLGRELTGDFLVLVGARDNVLALGAAYLRVLFLGSPFLFFSMFSRSILVGQGDSRTPVIIMGSSTILNLLLDPIFIFVFRWGVAGAAGATLASFFASSCAFFYFLFLRRTSTLTVSFRVFRVSGEILYAILRLGMSASFGQFVTSVGGMLFNRLISIFGSDAVAAFGLGTRVDMLVVLPLMGISTALLSAVGMFYGASRRDLVLQVSISTIKWTMFVSLAIGSLVFVFARPLIGIFTHEAAVIDMGATYLRYTSFIYPLVAFGLNSGNVFLGLGRGLPGVLVVTIRVFVVSIPLAYLFTRLLDMGLSSVWLAFILSRCVASMIFVVMLRKYRRDTEWRNQDWGKMGG